MLRMRLYRKVVFGNRVLCGIYGIFLVLMFAKPVYVSIRVCKQNGLFINEVNEALLSNCFYLFAFCLLVAYEFVHQIQMNQISECLQSQENRRYYKDSFLFILLHIFLILLISGILSLGTTILCGRASVRFIRYIMENTIFYYIVSGVVGSLLGFLCTLSRRKKMNVLLMLGLLFVFSPLFQSVILTSSQTGIIIFKLMTSIFPNTVYSPIIYYGYQITSYQYCLALVWIGTLSLFLLVGIKKIRSLALGFAVVGMLIGVLGMTTLDPGLITLENRKEGYLESYYYSGFLEAKKSKEPLEQQESSASKTEFSVLRYDMELSCYTQLKAKVTMELSFADTTSYTFTLYNRYYIDQIANENGKILNYTREGNYVTVEKEKTDTQIVFTYHGRGNPCYANSDGIYLRAGFPWYPIPGKQTVFSEKGEIIACEAAESEYHVKLDCIGDAYCNLAQQTKKQYQGVSDGVMIVQGLLTEKEYDGVKYVYPILYEYQFDMEQLIVGMSEGMNDLAANEGIEKPETVFWGNTSVELQTSSWGEVYRGFWLLPHGCSNIETVMENLVSKNTN